MNEKESVVVGAGEGAGRIRTRLVVARMLLIAGCAFALVGFADMALLWLPANPGNVAWEYATVGRTLDSLPLSSLGLLLIAYGVLRDARPTRNGVLFVSAIFILFALFTAFLAFLILTSAPAVISQTPPEAADAVRRSATRHGVQGVIYPLAWFAIAIIVWRARDASEVS
ncbi:MAG: hypothetical protein ACC682_12295 [Gemmatimonadota bacterium]